MRLLLVMDDPSDLEGAIRYDGDLLETITAHSEEDELMAGLRDAGHEVGRFRGLRRLLSELRSATAACDLVLNCSDGLKGPDSAGWAASILDTAGIPYMGSPALSLALQRDKALTKALAQAVGARTPPSVTIASSRDTIPEELRFPAIVKPIGKSSSIGLIEGRSVVHGRHTAMERALELVELYEQPALVETFIRGIEVEVPVLMDPEIRALGVVVTAVGGAIVRDDIYLTSEIVKKSEYEYMEPPVGFDHERVTGMAVAVAKALGVRDYGRIDFRVDADGTPWLIEANGHPSLQRHSGFAWLGRRKQRSYPMVLDAVVRTCAWRAQLIAPPDHTPWTLL